MICSSKPCYVDKVRGVNIESTATENASFLLVLKKIPNLSKHSPHVYVHHGKVSFLRNCAQCTGLSHGSWFHHTTFHTYTHGANRGCRLGIHHAGFEVSGVLWYGRTAWGNVVLLVPMIHLRSGFATLQHFVFQISDLSFLSANLELHLFNLCSKWSAYIVIVPFCTRTQQF